MQKRSKHMSMCRKKKDYTVPTVFSSIQHNVPTLAAPLSNLYVTSLTPKKFQVLDFFNHFLNPFFIFFFIYHKIAKLMESWLHLSLGHSSCGMALISLSVSWGRLTLTLATSSSAASGFWTHKNN